MGEILWHQTPYGFKSYLLEIDYTFSRELSSLIYFFLCQNWCISTNFEDRLQKYRDLKTLIYSGGITRGAPQNSLGEILARYVVVTFLYFLF